MEKGIRLRGKFTNLQWFFGNEIMFNEKDDKRLSRFASGNLMFRFKQEFVRDIPFNKGDSVEVIIRKARKR